MNQPIPKACTREEFMSAFKLPKIDWRQAGNGESFKIAACNAITGETVIFARTGNNHWTFIDNYLLNHAEIMTRIQTIINQERSEDFIH